MFWTTFWFSVIFFHEAFCFPFKCKCMHSLLQIYTSKSSQQFWSCCLMNCKYLWKILTPFFQKEREKKWGFSMVHFAHLIITNFFLSYRCYIDSCRRCLAAWKITEIKVGLWREQCVWLDFIFERLVF